MVIPYYAIDIIGIINIINIIDKENLLLIYSDHSKTLE